MKVTRGYKVELDLNNVQTTACLKHAGAARWAYNWGLSRYQQEYQAGRRVSSAMSLHRELNTLKQTDVPWMYEVSKCAPQESLRDLEKAFKNFFRKCKLKKIGKWRGKCGYPKTKSKKKGIGSFRLTGTIHVGEGHVHTVSRWEPSSKTCSWCGWIDEDLTLSDRIFHCKECGYVIDRDFNAAINLALDAAG